MNTEITLLNHTGDRVHKSDIIRAGGSTIVTADTAVRVNHDNTIISSISGLHRANGIADGTFALVT
jgi:hypothetical protein